MKKEEGEGELRRLANITAEWVCFESYIRVVRGSR